MISNFQLDIAFINELYGGLKDQSLNSRSVIAMSVSILERSINLLDQLHRAKTVLRADRYRYFTQIKNDIEYVEFALGDITYSYRLMALIARIKLLLQNLKERITRRRKLYKNWKSQSFICRILKPFSHELVIHHYLEDLHHSVLMVDIIQHDVDTKTQLRQSYSDCLDDIVKSKHSLRTWQQIDDLRTLINAI